MPEIALIVGAGQGLSASLARLFHAEGMQVALAARNPDKLDGLAAETNAKLFACDTSSPDDVAKLFEDLDASLGSPNVVVFNPSARVRGPFTEIDPLVVRDAIMVTCYGGFLVAQEAAKRMTERGAGSILFTGATASVKGVPQSAAFAMGKFGLRGLAQSMARELQPKNIHVAHFIIDGAIENPDRPWPADKPEDSRLHPDSIAETYLHIHRQHRSAWTWEVELRPWVESF